MAATAMLIGICITSSPPGTDTLLNTLPRALQRAGWRVYDKSRDPEGATVAAFSKQLGATKKKDAAPAVVKVEAQCRIPVKQLLDTFRSTDEATVAEWNPFAGEIKHIDKAVQLQTYQLPWPFASREYLVRCTDRSSKKGHEAHCASIEAHPGAPERPDRVRYPRWASNPRQV